MAKKNQSVDRAARHAQVGKRGADQVLVKDASNCGFFSGKGKGPNGIHGRVAVLVILKVAGFPLRSKFGFLCAGNIELLLGAGVIEFLGAGGIELLLGACVIELLP
jgi:hypothetical protein